MKLTALCFALSVGAVACGGSSPSATCTSACQKILTCSGGAGYGYGFGYRRDWKLSETLSDGVGGQDGQCTLRP